MKRPSHWCSTALVWSAAILTRVSADGIESHNFTVPPSHYDPELSFRGLTKEGKVDKFTASGHVTALPGVHDFVRLVPPTPLAHGALFTVKPMGAEEWIAEIAFRVHGPAVHGLGEVSEDGAPIRARKGGRGLAFWYTKHTNPGPITISNDPKVRVSNPPPVNPQTPKDPTDNDVSLFGSKTSFDGLGIIFDTMPTQPLYRRSDHRNWDPPTDSHHGLSANGGVVSGLLDDGSGGWLEPDNRKMSPSDEAAYLEKAIGECEAAFRNANGLIWARVSYMNHTIRVDLDLSPHTSLAKAGRDYAHNCFVMSGVILAPGNHIGVSALASGYTEPDAVDIYALDVFEVNQPNDDHDDDLEPPLDDPEAPLEGTTNDVAKMMDAIDGLSRKIDLLGRLVRAPLTSKVFSGAGTAGTADSPVRPQIDAQLRVRLDQIDAKLKSLHQTSPLGGAAAVVSTSSRDDREVLRNLLQQSERLLAEVTAFGRRLDTANGQSLASLAALSTRTADILDMLRRAQENVEKAVKTKPNLYMWLGAVGFVLAVLGMLLGRRRRPGGGWNDKKSF
ncbi:hypothetical protein OIO90_003716 [Microbotryomycetes sp. JL221]|nr:hypothetical protein OIO90_003716 [Microbotryomycetes sp. JL221]